MRELVVMAREVGRQLEVSSAGANVEPSGLVDRMANAIAKADGRA